MSFQQKSHCLFLLSRENVENPRNISTYLLIRKNHSEVLKCNQTFTRKLPFYFHILNTTVILPKEYHPLVVHHDTVLPFGIDVLVMLLFTFL